ncbi:MAG: hypothetical protein LQ348_001418 [Seirophora lacunosa]|nr:MAG: hypothetical protein LQ344_002919 [Seirophora lacunosa]KAI4203209.1 MAG: hypothetical protein LQ348_001418 [Seirophora lacunosa]
MAPHESGPTFEPPPRYVGEDTRPTSKKELSGWYSYGFAAEVFVVCGIGSFIPITLEQLARERGVLLSDRSKPCVSNLNEPDTNTANTAHTSHLLGRESSPRAKAGPCIVQVLGTDINTASFAMYTFSISVFIQALVIISMSGAADHGVYRKRLLLYFAFTGAIATMLFVSIIPRVYLLGGLLAIVANVCFGASFVLLNSFLPLLVRHHPTIQCALPEQSSQGGMQVGISTESEFIDMDDSTEALLGQPQDKRTQSYNRSAASAELLLSTSISSNGIGIGYVAAVIVQLIAVAIILITTSMSKSNTVALRIVLLFIGSWWLAFTIPAALWLRPRPGPPIPFSTRGKQRRNWAGYIAYAWGSLWKTVRRARRLKDIVLFLAAWFLLSDGIATVSGTAVLFAKTELGMTAAQLAMINVVVTLFGITGAFTWSKVSRFFGLSPARTIVACICFFEFIPLYALLAYIPAVQKLGVMGLQQPWEVYVLGAVYGIVLGGLSSHCRSLFGELIPSGSEAAFYALYAITDKGSSIFGPAIVGAITDRYGNIRPAFVFLAVLILIPLPLMMLVNVDRGKEEAAAMAKELEGKQGTVASPGEGIVLLDEEIDEHQNGTS